MESIHAIVILGHRAEDPVRAMLASALPRANLAFSAGHSKPLSRLDPRAGARG
jgi:hypothetical protein